MLKIQDVGIHLVAGFEGAEISDHLLFIIKELGAGGVILFDRNFESPEQLSDLTRKIREIAGRRIFIGIDQEGGRVARLKSPFTIWPSMEKLGRIGDVKLAAEFGAALALELLAVGIDWDFAPVMDVNSNPDNPIIGDRAFGNHPKLVSKMGTAVIGAMQNKGIMACAKHYPGHGDTEKDSHLELPMVMVNEDEIYARELVPFVAAIDAGVASIMPAHVVYPALDVAHPASTSRVLIEGKLRNALAYQGLVITDDLEMKAVKDKYEPVDLALMAAMAGNDFLLVCNNSDMQEFIVKALFDARLNNILPAEIFIKSEKRIEEAAGKFPEPQGEDFSVIGCEKHRILADEIEKKGESF